jgi:hypothetical protein
MRRILESLMATVIAPKAADHRFTNREIESFYELVGLVILMLVYFFVYST